MALYLHKKLRVRWLYNYLTKNNPFVSGWTNLFCTLNFLEDITADIVNFTTKWYHVICYCLMYKKIVKNCSSFLLKENLTQYIVLLSSPKNLFTCYFPWNFFIILLMFYINIALWEINITGLRLRGYFMDCSDTIILNV